ncbi:hypothetical protein [Actinoplanes sp. G11-F43]|uniref:hypothetical protein n=1 Tax=Actinoplanes sp. G11-F43 TaxID=3424130 RepID=UPI003D35051F
MEPHADPHIHVEAGALRSRAAERNMVASLFGLAATLPPEVSTPCGLRVPFAMTSGSPDRVTCLPCREYAAAQYRILADQVVDLGLDPQVATAHRETARRFHDGDGP